MNSNQNKAAEEILPISDLYPNLTPEEEQEAEYFLTKYLELVFEISENKKY